MVAELGGPADLVEKSRHPLPKAKVECAFSVPKDGYVAGVATREIGLAVLTLGGGRARPEDSVGHSVGLTRLLSLGAEVKAGEVLVPVHARSESDAGHGWPRSGPPIRLGETKLQPPK